MDWIERLLYDGMERKIINVVLFHRNFHDNMAQTVATLDPRCNNATMDRVNAMAEWLTNLRDNACPDIDAEREAWQKCMGAVRCVQGLGNFTERSGSCRYYLTHLSLGTPKRVIGKQCRPRSDATECGI